MSAHYSDSRVSSPLVGAHVVVVGGSSGMGLAVARLAASVGAKVTIGGRDAGRLAAASDALSVATARIDVTDEDSVRDFFATVGPMDHLITCPGDAALGPVTDIDLAQARRCFDTKFFGQLLCARHGADSLSPTGSLTLLSGVIGWRSQPGAAVLAAANLSVHALGRTLAAELAPRRVNVVAPGLTDTPFWDEWDSAVRDEIFESTAAALPVGRIGTPDDVAHAVVALLENGFISGTTVHVDGGALV